MPVSCPLFGRALPSTWSTMPPRKFNSTTFDLAKQQARAFHRAHVRSHELLSKAVKWCVFVSCVLWVCVGRKVELLVEASMHSPNSNPNPMRMSTTMPIPMPIPMLMPNRCHCPMSGAISNTNVQLTFASAISNANHVLNTGHVIKCPFVTLCIALQLGKARRTSVARALSAAERSALDFTRNTPKPQSKPPTQRATRRSRRDLSSAVGRQATGNATQQTPSMVPARYVCVCGEYCNACF